MILKATRSDVELMDLGADVSNMRRIRNGEMILKLKRDETRKGVVYKCLAEEVL